SANAALTQEELAFSLNCAFQALAREEKRREEKNNTTQANASVADKQRAPKKQRGPEFAPDDLEVTREMRQWALMEHPGVDVPAQTRAFRDHEFAKAYTDWVKTWRNWIRRAHTNAPNARGSPSRPPTQAALTMAQACPSLAAPHLRPLVQPY